MEAIGVGVFYGAMVGGCVAFFWALAPRWSGAVAKWAAGYVTVFTLVGFMAIPPWTCGGKGKAYMSAMKSDLRNLATAQEMYFVDSGMYASTVAGLDYSTSTGVFVQVVAVSDSGWFAAATHEYTQAMCRIFIGTGVPQHGREGEPRCIEG
jgi:hypothetical protein